MGRGPNATISFTYCMARFALMVGAGPTSEGAPCGAGVECDATGFSAACDVAWASHPREQAREKITKTAKHRGAQRKILNRIFLGHGRECPSNFLMTRIAPVTLCALCS